MKNKAHREIGSPDPKGSGLQSRILLCVPFKKQSAIFTRTHPIYQIGRRGNRPKAATWERIAVRAFRSQFGICTRLHRFVLRSHWINFGLCPVSDWLLTVSGRSLWKTKHCSFRGIRTRTGMIPTPLSERRVCQFHQMPQQAKRLLSVLLGYTAGFEPAPFSGSWFLKNGLPVWSWVNF